MASAHDAMAEEYDELDDLWYSWIFTQVHSFITTNLPPGGGSPALDVGCGTGLQSFLLARAGYSVTAFDVSTKLLELARQKTAQHAQLPAVAPPLFSSDIEEEWVAQHHRTVADRLDELRGSTPIVAPEFSFGDAAHWDYEVSRYAVVNCCGSVLSFVDDYEAVIAQIARSLRPDGLLFLEVEQRMNADLVWPFVDRALAGRLDYNQTSSMMLRNLSASPHESTRLAYPFPLKEGHDLDLNIWLFSVSDLEAIFRRYDLVPVDHIGIHQVTNLLPSTLLHRASPESRTGRWMRVLRRIDRALARKWPFWRLGCSVAYALKRSV